MLVKMHITGPCPEIMDSESLGEGELVKQVGVIFKYTYI